MSEGARFHGDLAYDDQFNRIVTDFEEGERIAGTLGNRSILFMVNHGVTVVGRNVADAFDKRARGREPGAGHVDRGRAQPDE